MFKRLVLFIVSLLVSCEVFNVTFVGTVDAATSVGSMEDQSFADPDFFFYCRLQ